MTKSYCVNRPLDFKQCNIFLAILLNSNTTEVLFCESSRKIQRAFRTNKTSYKVIAELEER